MIVLHMWFLSRRLRITIKDIGSGLTGQRIVFKESNLFKLRASVGEDEGKEFEEIISEDILKQVKRSGHGFRSFFVMKDTDHKRGILKRESLDKRAALLIVESIHFRSGNAGVLFAKQKIVGILVTVIINRSFAFFNLFSFTHGDLSSQREVINTEIPENTTLDICIKRFNGYIKFGMVFKNVIKRLAFGKKRTDSLSNEDSVRFRQVYTLPGIGQMKEVLFVSRRSVVEEMIQSAFADAFAMIAGADGTVTQQTGLLYILRTFFRTMPVGFGTAFEICADDRGIKTITGL